MKTFVLMLVAGTATSLGCLPEHLDDAGFTPDRQDEALTLVWSESYGEDMATIPAVKWHVAGDGSCAFSESGGDQVAGYRETDGSCYFDLMRLDAWTTDVAWQGSFHRSEVAHSLCHAHAWLTLTPGDMDPDHQGDCFLGGLVNQVNEKLTAAGL